jgi:hypothetical protein
VSDVREELRPGAEALVMAYVVQVREVVDIEPDEPYDVWRDVATVEVPPRTKRRTVLERGLEQAGITKTPDLEARCLDPEASYRWRAKPPEPQSLRLT